MLCSLNFKLKLCISNSLGVTENTKLPTENPIWLPGHIECRNTHKINKLVHDDTWKVNVKFKDNR